MLIGLDRIVRARVKETGCGGYHQRFMSRRRWLTGALLIGLGAACDEPFQPFQEEDAGAFSMFGYLDLGADTQWVRVMPVRHSLFLEPGPLDAVVTLENLGSGRIVTLNDSIITTRDERLGRTAYAHNFWTTEPLESGAEYRLKAVRPGGDSSTALVELPEEMDLDFLTNPNNPLFGSLRVRAERLLFSDVLYLKRNMCEGGAFTIFEDPQEPSTFEGGFPVRADATPPECYAYFRPEVRVVTVKTDWPYDPDMSDIEIAVPGIMPSNVENGMGFVGGVEKLTSPFHVCEIRLPRQDRTNPCEATYNSRSASVVGRVIRQPCGAAHALQPIRIVEEFANGGAIARRWTTGPSGEYRFEGLEPGSLFVLELTPGTAAVRLPALAPGERYVAPDIVVPAGC